MLALLNKEAAPASAAASTLNLAPEARAEMIGRRVLAGLASAAISILSPVRVMADSTATVETLPAVEVVGTTSVPETRTRFSQIRANVKVLRGDTSAAVTTDSGKSSVAWRPSMRG